MSQRRIKNTVLVPVGIVQAVGPDDLVWPSYEVAIFQGLASHLVDDRVGLTRGVVDYEGDRWFGCVV